MPFYNQFLAAPLSPSLPESQTASHIIYRERHIRPHAYRPFRIPIVKNETTAHDFITRLLSMGDDIPHGAFLPSSKSQGPAGKPVAAVIRVDRPSKEKSVEGSTLPKLSLRRQRTVHPQSPAAATSLGRGASCSSTASTVRPDPPKPKQAAKPSRTLPSLKILAPLPSFEVISTPTKDTHSPPSSEDEEVVTPQHRRGIELPCVGPEEVIGEDELEAGVKGIAIMPGTPLNIPPTPLDIPVDWDDLRQRWSPHGFAHRSAQEEEWSEGEDYTYDEISGGAPVEEVEEPPAPTHAYAAGGITPSTSISEIKLSSITSKDLGECFLLEPMQLQLRASALFSDGWTPSVAAPLEAQGARGATVRRPTSSSTSRLGHRRRDSSPTADAGVLGATPVLPPAAAVAAPPTAAPRASMWPTTRPPTEPLPTAAPAPTTRSPPPLRPALKSENQARKKRHGRLVSFDEAALVMRTVRFSCTLDPQFNYTRFEQRNSSAVSIDSYMIEDIVGAGSKPCKEPLLGAGESFFSVPSPVTPTAPRVPLK